MCSVLLGDVQDVYLNSFCFGFRLHEGAEADGLFLAYHLRSKEGRELMKSLAQGSTRYNLSKVALLKSPLRLPKLPEQRAIATALSDVDRLLGGLDLLIAKKRDLKQATMQQLLTGQTRLPGFRAEWEMKHLGDIVARLPKTTRQSSDGKLEGRYPFFTNSTQPVDKYLDNKDFDQEVIIANTGGVAYFDYYNGPFAAMSDCMVLSANVNTKWLFYLLKALEVSINDAGFTGSGIKHLDKKYFFDLSIRIPRSSEEQASIACVLTDMDSELEALEARRNKTLELKQGMMQELLTGRIRLVQAEALHA
jgi:type I restriction enzyme S subunit